MPVQAQTSEIDALRTRAEQGDAKTQVSLGFMYRDGEDVPQDDVLAHMWFNLAASRAPTRGLRELTVGNLLRLEGNLTPDALNEAQRLALEWDAAHPREP